MAKTRQEIINVAKRLHDNGEKVTFDNLKVSRVSDRQLYKHFKNIYELREIIGAPGHTNWTQEKINQQLKKLKLEFDEKGWKFTRHNLHEKSYGSLVRAVIKIYKTWNNGLKANGIEINRVSPGTSTEEFLEAWFWERYESGKDVTHGYVSGNYGSIRIAIQDLYDTYENFVEAQGVDYDNICLNRFEQCGYGKKYERIVSEILAEFNYDFKDNERYYTDEEKVEYIIPDFVFDDGTWADAKLSNNKAVLHETMKSYEPYCNELTLIVLRGINADTNEKLSDKTRMVSIYQYTKLLPEGKRIYYEDKLQQLHEESLTALF